MDFFRFPAMTALFLLSANVVLGQGATPTPGGPPFTGNAVEIDWQIDLLQPSALNCSPQISLAMAAESNFNHDFATFHINPRDLVMNGGAKVEVWRDLNTYLGRSNLPLLTLGVPNEQVLATTRIARNGAEATYCFSALSSSTWGTVPTADLPCLTVPSSGQLNYDIALTMSNTEIELGANRVAGLAIVEVRFYTGAAIQKDTTLRVLYQHPGTVSTGATSSEIDNNTAY